MEDLLFFWLKSPPYLDLDWPTEVGHVHEEGDVVVKLEVELLAWKTVFVFLDVGPHYNGHLFTRDGSSWKQQKYCRLMFSAGKTAGLNHVKTWKDPEKLMADTCFA